MRRDFFAVWSEIWKRLLRPDFLTQTFAVTVSWSFHVNSDTRLPICSLILSNGLYGWTFTERTN